MSKLQKEIKRLQKLILLFLFILIDIFCDIKNFLEIFKMIYKNKNQLIFKN